LLFAVCELEGEARGQLADTERELSDAKSEIKNLNHEISTYGNK
jgi:hypothetical protein